MRNNILNNSYGGWHMINEVEYMDNSISPKMRRAIMMKNECWSCFNQMPTFAPCYTIVEKFINKIGE